MSERELRIGLVSISDRAAGGVYKDEGLPALKEWFGRALASKWRTEERLIADEQPVIEATLKELVDDAACDLVLTTGGTGPAPRDVTPEATEAVCSRMIPGFGELMRMASLREVPTAILSRQTAGVRGRTLIVNLPGKPASIRTCLNAVFPAIPYCVDLIGGDWMDSDPNVCITFRPGR